jgi:hypothetical protein
VLRNLAFAIGSLLAGERDTRSHRVEALAPSRARRGFASVVGVTDTWNRSRGWRHICAIFLARLERHAARLVGGHANGQSGHIVLA